jgi:DNA-binding CsgD family transcriptional regulator
MAQAYTLEVRTEGVSLGDYVSTKLSRAAVQNAFASAIAQDPRFGSFNPLQPEREQQNIALRSKQLKPLDDGREGPLEQMLPRFGLSVRHQMRALVCTQGRLLAWVGGYREDGFGPREVAILNRLTPALRDRLSVERLLADAELTRLGLVAALERLGRPAFVVSGGGSVVFMNETAQTLWRSDPKKVREHLRLSLGERRENLPFESVPLSSGQGCGGFLLLGRLNATGRMEAACTLLEERHGLTQREAQVLRLVAQGSTNLQAGLALGCSERTVEQHVGRLLQKLDCAHRAGLVARLLEAS